MKNPHQRQDRTNEYEEESRQRDANDAKDRLPTLLAEAVIALLEGNSEFDREGSLRYIKYTLSQMEVN